MQADNTFYIATIGSFAQYRYAWAEAAEARVRWSVPPAPDYCPVCGPGGGGVGGTLRSISSVNIEAGTWDGSDIFFPINLPGTLFLSERGHRCFEKHRFTNCTVIPCRDWSLRFGA